MRLIERGVSQILGEFQTFRVLAQTLGVWVIVFVCALLAQTKFVAQTGQFGKP